jgi:FlaA1/EpsC-like NDP-sugar epimerase
VPLPAILAARLVLEGSVLARGGEVLVTKRQVISIMDLAQVMVERLAPYYGHDPAVIEFKLIGAKPEVKMYEQLLSYEEMCRSLELPEMFVVLPTYRARYRNIPGLCRRNR